MRLDAVAFLIFLVPLGLCDGFQPVFSKISVRKSDQVGLQGLVYIMSWISIQRLMSTTEDPDAYSNYDPFDLDGMIFFLKV